MGQPIIYSIGHSNHPIETFIAILQRAQIEALVDVRSAPYSRFNPQFNRDALEKTLQVQGIVYHFAGKFLGGRPDDPTCYKAGVIPEGKAHYLSLVDYAEVAKRPWYLIGIERLIALASEHPTVMMCSEGDPLRCHRHHLITKTLLEREISVYHLREKPEQETIESPGDRVTTPEQARIFADEPYDHPVIETPRLLLRKLTLADVSDVYAFMSDAEMTHYTVWSTAQRLADSHAYVQSMIDRYEQGQPARWGMVHKETHAVIGTCGFAHWNKEHHRVEVGYALARQFWGQGLTSEAVSALIAFGFEHMDLNRIEAFCMVGNTASARVMEKVGMTFEGIVRQHMFVKGRYHDFKLYAILHKEYQTLAD